MFFFFLVMTEHFLSFLLSFLWIIVFFLISLMNDFQFKYDIIIWF